MHQSYRPPARRAGLPRLALAVAALAGCGGSTPDAASGPALCADPSVIAALPPELTETSGLAASVRHPELIWAHNDSERSPVLHGLDRNGRLAARIALPAARTQSDWEDIAVAPCASGSCVYIGDIGDNRHNRQDRAILRLAEPEPADVDSPVERFPFRYPDGPHDAEALFVTDSAIAYIITKGRDGPVTVYRYPPPFRSRERVTLSRVQQLSSSLVQVPDMVTGADVRGDFVILRTYSRLHAYRLDADSLVSIGSPYALGAYAGPQGEAVAFGVADTVYIAGESGPGGVPGRLTRLQCAPARSGGTDGAR